MKLEECKDRKVHIGKLAEAMGYSKAFISAVVSGRTAPKKRFLLLLEHIALEDVLKDYAKDLLNKS